MKKVGAQKVQDNHKVANKSKLHFSQGSKSEASLGHKLRMTVYFLWFIKFGPLEIKTARKAAGNHFKWSGHLLI